MVVQLPYTRTIGYHTPTSRVFLLFLIPTVIVNYQQLLSIPT
jgi:hypothetical protein